MLQDIYCLDADGALFDAALLSAVAALSHCKSCMLSHLVLCMVHSNACSMANSNSLEISLAHNPTQPNNIYCLLNFSGSMVKSDVTL
jgi:exosome complex RNA-binding protein Rrp42 (RNase PH superfamily)